MGGDRGQLCGVLFGPWGRKGLHHVRVEWGGGGGGGGDGGGGC